MWQHRCALVIVLAALIAPATASADLPPDDDLEQRRVDTLREVSKRYEQKQNYTSCVNAGFSAIGLMAQFALDDLGDGDGRNPAGASSEIENIADSLYDLTGTSSSSCAWEQAGSPAVMHGALAIGYILHQWHDELPQSTRDSIVTALEGHWRSSLTPYLVNGNLSVIAGRLLAGEVLGYDSNLWQQGSSDLQEVYERAMRLGAIEVNAPLYSAYHVPPLTLLQELDDDEFRHRARALLEYELIVQAHLYLPGGGLGAPQSRDRNYGGAVDGTPTSMHRIISFLTGEENYQPTQNVHLAGAASSYQLPEALRAIFLDKGDGYEFWTWADSPVSNRFPDTTYPFGPGGATVAPWQIVATPGGDAMWGINHGFRFQAIHVSSGVYARADDGSFPILYHYQPYVEGDTTETGGGLPSTNGDSEPEDFVRELYDYERFGHHRAFISVWDPTEQLKDSNVTRNEQYTLAHIPDYEAHGGQMRVDDSGWMVGSAGEAYIAYYPLGDSISPPDRRSSIPGAKGSGTRDSAHYRIKLDGRSGCIVELATTDEFSSIDDYLDDLKQRHVDFSPDGSMYAEFDARDPDSGDLDRMRLEYYPEKRELNGSDLSEEEALDHGLFESPWVDVRDGDDTIVVERDCYDRLTYDVPGATIHTEAAPADCGAPEETVFSPIDYYGDFENWEPKTDSRWAVIEHEDDLRLYLRPFDFVADGDRLGEYALVNDRTFGDFEATLRAKSNVEITDDSNADFAVIFGMQDESNYYFLLGNSTPEYSELFALEDGERTSLGVTDRALVPDEKWQEVSVEREGSAITISHDGDPVLEVDDDTFGEGRVGVGSLNDSVYFDDIAFVDPDAPLEDAGSDDTGRGDTGAPAADAGPDAGDGHGGSDAGDGEESGVEPSGEDGCGCSAGVDGGVDATAFLLFALLWLRRRN